MTNLKDLFAHIVGVAGKAPEDAFYEEWLDMVSFDDWGKPCDDNAGGSPQTTDRTLTISDGSASRQIIITKNTGFIQ